MKDYVIDEYVKKTLIYESAESLLNFLGVSCVLVFRDYKGELFVLDNAQPFGDAFDFQFDND